MTVIQEISVKMMVQSGNMSQSVLFQITLKDEAISVAYRTPPFGSPRKSSFTCVMCPILFSCACFATFQ